MDNRQEKKNIYSDLMKDFPMLYCQKNVPCTHTCMCWGIEAGEGWAAPIRKLSEKLEKLNNKYWPSSHVRIQADQVKEKFGTLHFYYTVTVDPSVWAYKAHLLVMKLRKMIQKNINFKMKDIQMKPQTTEYMTKEVTFKEYKDELLSGFKASNVTYDIRDAKIYRITKFERFPVYAYKPTKHKLIYWIYKKLIKADSYFNSRIHESKYTEDIIDLLSKEAETAVNDAVEECYRLCEFCGKEIGTKDSPRCATTGWLNYVCKDCADDTGFDYTMNKEVWNKRKRILTAEEALDRDKKAEEKMQKKFNEYSEKIRKEAEEQIKKTEDLLKEQQEKLKKLNEDKN